MNLPKLIAESRFALIDTETTGLSIKTDEVVQIAVCQMDFGRPRLRVYCTVRPSTPVKEGALRKHGLTDEKLAFSPTFVEIIDDVLGFIGDRALLGWGIRKFDLPILNRQLSPRALKAPYVDALLWNRRYDVGSHALEEAAARWGANTNGRHDAFADCQIIWRVFAAMANARDLGGMTLDEVVRHQERMS